MKYTGGIGCLINGGQMTIIKGDLEVIKIAKKYGFKCSIFVSTDSLIMDESLAAIEYLNNNVAEETYQFGWYEGDFFYQTLTWWSDAE